MTTEQSWQSAVTFIPQAFRIGRYINARGSRRPQEASDLAQEGLIEYAKVAQRFDPGRNVPIDGYVVPQVRHQLGRIASRDLRVYDRFHQLRKTYALRSRWANPEQRCYRAELRALLYRAMKRLTSRERQIIRLYYFEERSLHDVGTAVGLSWTTVWKYKADILHYLRSLMLASVFLGFCGAVFAQEAGIYMEHFGAVADGYTDNAAAITSAFSYAASHQGTRLLFTCQNAQKYCTYLTTQPVVFPAKTTIESMNAAASISYSPKTQPGTVPQGAFQITGDGYVTLKNIMLQTTANYPPKTIVFLARQGGMAGGNILDSVSIKGYATTAAVYTISAEVTTWHKIRVELDGGGGLYGFYTSGADDLKICSPACGQSSNLSVFVSDYQVLGYVGDSAQFIGIADALGGGTGDHYFRSGYIALNRNIKSIGVQLITGNSTQGGPNAIFHLSDTRVENGGYGLYLKKNGQSKIHHVNIEGYTFVSSVGTPEWFVYGENGVTLAASNMHGNFGATNGPSAETSIDALESSQISENYGPITVRTLASRNTLMGSGSTVYHLPVSNNTVIVSQ